MRLDMYINRTETEGGLLDEQPVPLIHGKPIDRSFMGGYQSVDREITILYFRKFNALHGWFVENLGDGVDECQKIYFDIDDVKRLLRDIDTALADPQGNEVLIPFGGFFFGSTDRNMDYVENLKYAKDGFTYLLSIMEEDERLAGKNLGRTWVTYHYRASW